MIKNFILLKNANKKEDKHPDYRMTAKIGETFVDIGAAWIKEGPKGKYLSCALSNPKDIREGYHIATEPAPLKEVKEENEINSEDIPF